MRVVKLSREENEYAVWQQIVSIERNQLSVIIADERDALNEDLNDLNIGFSDEDNASSSDEETEVKVCAGPDLSDEETEIKVCAGPDLKLRQYQKELAVGPLEGHNCIVCAPTGSGKTKVAIKIMLEHINKNPNAKIGFLARNTSLARQQYGVIKKYLAEPHNAFLLTGQSTRSMSLHIMLPHYTVAVLTPQILVNHMQGRSPLLTEGISAFTLLVFDECHHTREGEPYNELMTYYLKEKRRQTPGQRLPQIVGLTASIGVEKATNVTDARENILKVLGNLDADMLVTVKENTVELKRIVPVPKEVLERLIWRDEYDMRTHILNIIDKLENDARKYAPRTNDPEISKLMREIPQRKEAQEYCKWVVELYEAARVVKIPDEALETNMGVRCILIITEYLKEYHFALESIELAHLKDVIRFMARRFNSLRESVLKTPEENHLYGYFSDLQEIASLRSQESNPNLDILAEKLREHVICNSTEARAIIFVRTRMLAEAVANWLCNCEESDLVALNAKKFTSSNVPVENGGITPDMQQEVLHNFRTGQVRVIVATSIANEGLDIPQCNLIINYNCICNEVTKVQTRGRSRASDGLSIILGFYELLQREMMIRQREKLMKEAITQITYMSQRDVRCHVQNYHAELHAVWDKEAAEEEARRRAMRDVPFRVVCQKCRKVSVMQTNIRTIYGKYRVSIDRDLLNHIIVFLPGDEEEMDQLKFIGTAVCLGEVKPGTFCGSPLGTIVKYKGCPFVTLAIKKIAFHSESEDPLAFKKWKKVPYLVEEISSRDVMDYATKVFGPEEESDSDE